MAATSRGSLSMHAARSIPLTIESPKFTYTLFVGYDSDDAYFADPVKILAYEAVASPVTVQWISCDNPTHKPGI